MPPKKKDTIDPFLLLRNFSSQLRERADLVGLAKYKPWEKQEIFHSTDKQGRIFAGGNRSGKTVGGGAEMVMWLTGQHPVFSKMFPPPIRGRAVGVDFERGVAQILIPQIQMWMEPEYLINGSWEDSYHKASKVLTLKNGSTLEFMSYDQDIKAFMGTSRHCIWFDEEPPKNIFNECLARLIDTNGRWWLTLTPLQEFSWTSDLFEAARNDELENIFIIEAETTENPHINAQAVETLTALMDEDEIVARRTGSGFNQSQLIYPELAFSKDNILPDVVDMPEKWEVIKNHWQHIAMMDHGFRNATAILFLAVGPDDTMIVYDEYYKTGVLVRDNAKNYLEKVAELGVEIQYMVGDPSTQNTDPITGTSVRIEYSEHGVWYTLGNNDVHAGILRVKAALKTKRLFITTRCLHTLKEARSYKWAKPVSSKVEARTNKMELPVKRNDHAMDALRYGIMSLPEFESEVDEGRRQRLLELGIATRSADIFEYRRPESPEEIFDQHLGLLE